MEIMYRKGDLIKAFKEGEFDAIVHGCNCIHTMGAGIALQLNNFTNGKLLEVDKKTPYGDINKLGTYSKLDIECGTIYNLYTQYVPVSKGMVAVHWDSFMSGLIDIIEICDINNENEDTPTRIGIPLIGCGLAGGKPEDFENIILYIEKGLHSFDVELTIMELK